MDLADRIHTILEDMEHQPIEVTITAIITEIDCRYLWDCPACGSQIAIPSSGAFTCFACNAQLATEVVALSARGKSDTTKTGGVTEGGKAQ
jgi:hypothetical protein